MTRTPQAPETEPFLRKPSLSNSKLEDTWECVSVFFRSQLAVLLQSLWVSVDFSMKTPSSGFPTKAMFLPSHESDIVCQESGEQTMAGSDEGKNAGKTTGLSCYLKRNPILVNFHPAIFRLNTFPKFTHKLCRRTCFVGFAVYQ